MFNKVVYIAAIAGMITALLAVHANAEAVYFGQSAPLTGPLAENTRNFNTGLLAAFKELNDAGGAFGRTLHLHTLDDMGNPLVTVANVKALCTDPNIFALTSFITADSATYGLYTAAQYYMPTVGVRTGADLLRWNFNPLAFHVRTGYSDEAFAMLMLIGYLHQRRIFVVYQNDTFGATPFAATQRGIVEMGATLTGSLALNNTALTNSAENEQLIDQILATDPQAVFFFSELSVSANLQIAFRQRVNQITDKNITMMVGSWAEPILDQMKLQGVSIKNTYSSQVTPHPLSTTSTAAQKYRAALQAYLGSAITSKSYTYNSFEGYITGRFIIHLMKRTYTLSRSEFLTKTYEGLLYDIEELLLGPFSSSCMFMTTEEYGRSSMCNCTQGGKFISITEGTKNYEWAEVGSLTIPVSECFATPAILYKSILLGVMRDTPSLINTEALTKGLQSTNTEVKPTTSLATMPGTVTKEITLDSIYKLGNRTYLIGIFGFLPSEEQHEYMIVSGLTQKRVHSGMLQGYRRDKIFLLPTIQQELLAWAFFIASAPRSPKDNLQLQGGSPATPYTSVILLLSTSVTSVTDFPKMMEDSLRTANYQFEQAPQVIFFSDAAGLASAVNGAPSTAFVMIIGIESSAMSGAVVSALQNRNATGPHVGLMFSEAAAAWEGINSCAGADCYTATEHIHLLSNIPLWVSAWASSFSRSYRALRSTKFPSDAEYRHPLTAIGYLSSRFFNFLIEQSSPVGVEVLNILYKFGTVAIDDINLGTFEDTSCESWDCRCNDGVRDVNFYTAADILYDAHSANGVDTNTVHFDGCMVTYDPEPTTTDVAAIIGSAVGGVSFILIVIGFGVWLQGYLQQLHLNRYAPKKAPLCLLFTDVDSGATLWEKYPEIMPQAIEVHHEAIRTAIADNRCYEVKTVGDAFMIAAPTVIDGIMMAMDIQQNLYESEWPEGLDVNAVVKGDSNPNYWNGLRVRIGCQHAVEVEPKYDSVHRGYDYYGQDVNLAARVQAQAVGGQILVTKQTLEIMTSSPEYELIESTCVYRLAKADVELKGVAEPVTLFTVLPKELAGRFFAGETRPEGNNEETSTNHTGGTPLPNEGGRDYFSGAVSENSGVPNEVTMRMFRDCLELLPKEKMNQAYDLLLEGINPNGAKFSQRKKVNTVLTHLAKKAREKCPDDVGENAYRGRRGSKDSQASTLNKAATAANPSNNNNNRRSSQNVLPENDTEMGPVDAENANKSSPNKSHPTLSDPDNNNNNNNNSGGETKNNNTDLNVPKNEGDLVVSSPAPTA